MARIPASPSVPTNVCLTVGPDGQIAGLNQLSDALRRISDFMRANVAPPISQSAVTLGIAADLDLGDLSTIDKALITWDKLFLNRPTTPDDGENLTPNWLANWETFGPGITEIEFGAAGLYQLSWSLVWTAAGSTQDEAMTYPMMRTFERGIEYPSGAKSYSMEDTGIRASTVYPARCFDVRAGDKIGIYIERVAGDSTANWTLQTPSFLSIIKL